MKGEKKKKKETPHHNKQQQTHNATQHDGTPPSASSSSSSTTTISCAIVYNVRIQLPFANSHTKCGGLPITNLDPYLLASPHAHKPLRNYVLSSKNRASRRRPDTIFLYPPDDLPRTENPLHYTLSNPVGWKPSEKDKKNKLAPHKRVHTEI